MPVCSTISRLHYGNYRWRGALVTWGWERERTFAEPSATQSHFRTWPGCAVRYSLDFAENPSWVLNWRSSQPAEKTAEERAQMGIRPRGRYSAHLVSPFEIMRFSRARKS